MAAGKGVHFWCFAQSISALDSTWGKEHRKTLLHLAELVQILGFPRTDAEGAEELSKAIGTATYEARTENRSGTIAENRIVTANTQWQAGDSRALVRERLITPRRTHDPWARPPIRHRLAQGYAARCAASPSCPLLAAGGLPLSRRSQPVRHPQAARRGRLRTAGVAGVQTVIRRKSTMTGKHQALEDNENKLDETPVTSASPGNQAIDPPPTAEDDGEMGPGVSDPSTTAEEEAQMDQEAVGKTRTGSLDPNPSLKEILGLVRQVSTQIQHAQKDDGGRLKIGTRKLVEITDNLAAHAGEARSLLDELVAAGARERDLGKAADRIEETITGYREGFSPLGRRRAPAPAVVAGARAGRGRTGIPAARRAGRAAVPDRPPQRPVPRVKRAHLGQLWPHDC